MESAKNKPERRDQLASPGNRVAAKLATTQLLVAAGFSCAGP